MHKGQISLQIHNSTKSGARNRKRECETTMHFIVFTHVSHLVAPVQLFAPISQKQCLIITSSTLASLKVMVVKLASDLFFGSSVSFDIISDPRKGSQSIVIRPHKSNFLWLHLKKKHGKFSNTTNVGKNWDFNQTFGRFLMVHILQCRVEVCKWKLGREGLI